MIKGKNQILYFILLCIVIGILSACQNKPNEQVQDVIREPKLDEKSEKKRVQLSAFGDVLVHDRVYDVAETEDGYDFKPFTDAVKPYVADADIVFANQESMIGGAEKRLSSYPSFNSPKEVGDMLKDFGVDIVSTANNHTLDRGEAVIQSALQHWDTLGIDYVGSYQSAADRDQIRVLEREGIEFSFLAYTYGTNGIRVPADKPYLVNLIDREQIEKDVLAAKKGSDVVIVSMHFGLEYEHFPNNEQQELVHYLADLEVDVVLGHHPHVLQPPDKIIGEAGNEMYVIYSLGNFFSGQHDLETRLGGIFSLDFVQEDGTIIMENPQMLLTHVQDHTWIVEPLEIVDEEILPNKSQVIEDTKAHMRLYLPELEFVKSD